MGRSPSIGGLGSKGWAFPDRTLSTVEAPPSSSDEDEDIQLEPEDYKQVSANHSASLTNISLVQSLAKGCCCSAERDSAPDQVLS